MTFLRLQLLKLTSVTCMERCAVSPINVCRSTCINIQLSLKYRYKKQCLSPWLHYACASIPIKQRSRVRIRDLLCRRRGQHFANQSPLPDSLICLTISCIKILTAPHSYFINMHICNKSPSSNQPQLRIPELFGQLSSRQQTGLLVYSKPTIDTLRAKYYPNKGNNDH